jgi:hypothetical protein
MWPDEGSSPRPVPKHALIRAKPRDPSLKFSVACSLPELCTQLIEGDEVGLN